VSALRSHWARQRVTRYATLARRSPSAGA
jgi:hypothetical protein